MSIRRLVAIVRKELVHIVRDLRNLFLVTISPGFLLLLLSNVFIFDATRLQIAALDLDHSSLSRQYMASLTADGDVVLSEWVASQQDIFQLLLAGKVDAGLVLPPGFEDAVLSGKPAQVQVIVDGTDPFTGRRAVSSLETRSAAFVMVGNVVSARAPSPSLVEIRTRALYNAGLTSLWSMVPALLAIVLIMPTMAFALALSREKETGTLEGLMATPLSGLEYLSGKLIAYLVMALLSALFAWLIAVLWFQVPFRARLSDYLLLAVPYFLACMGAAVVVTHFVRSQQTAMFIVLLIFVVPSFFLSGLLSPVATESVPAALTSFVLPSTHFVHICRSVFLKGQGVLDLAQPALILLGMGGGALSLGLLLFRKRVA